MSRLIKDAWFNVSMNDDGIMGYRTPDVDRIAKSTPLGLNDRSRGYITGKMNETLKRTCVPGPLSGRSTFL
jgi:hypothetical protein